MNARTNVLQVSDAEQKHTVEQYKVFERTVRLVTAGDHFAEEFGGGKGATDYADTNRYIELDGHTLYNIELWGLEGLSLVKGDVVIETVYEIPQGRNTYGFKTVFTQGVA